MVTIIFRAQIGRNLEVYVDDIVVKSLKAEYYLADLDETFNNLRKNIMRLNPAKFIFGVESGKFLGFMVSLRGIEVNLEKIRAIVEMKPPKSMKDIQRLTGRVVALHRFISKSADKCLPFFKIMSVMKPRMMEISIDPDTPSWTDSIISFLRDGTVPEDKMRLRKKVSRYTLIDGVLYKRSFSLPLLRCLNPYEAEYALQEVHEGVCGSHIGVGTLAHKVLR
ncbi:hypothetical protein SLEP1_g44141 [Rubroshorea leprosula]|uniref:Reverse transcriptase domain-containing protein n=1 Tax=Rubroshorea leprosula TaxID=152421 RepID=A0AAV5LF90_9ROSI|nr:hypothetical protein SLEP1_g44141 [Rubroshorea leprosula]